MGIREYERFQGLYEGATDEIRVQWQTEIANAFMTVGRIKKTMGHHALKGVVCKGPCF